MAFGDALHANGATVVLTADTGQFNAEIRAAEEVWSQTTGAMSRDALKLDLAQQRLRKSLATYGAESAQAKRATIGLRDAEEQAQRAATRTSSALQGEERSLGRLGRGAVAGSGAFRGLGRSVAFASSYFLGGAGLLYALKTAVERAKQAEVTQGQLAVALKDAGLSWRDNSEQIERNIASQSRLSSFYKEDLAQSFTLFVRTTKDVNQALKLNALAADVARGRNMGLMQAAQLLVRVQAGQVGSLRRLGIEVQKGITGTQALADVQRQFAGAAQKYSNSAAGAQDRFNNTLRQTEEVIGRALLPTFTHLLQSGATWLDQMNRSGRLQRDVQRAVRDTTNAMHDLGTVVHYVDQVTGSFKTTLEILIGLKIAGMVAGWVTQFGRLVLVMRGLKTQTGEAAVAMDGLSTTARGLGGTHQATRQAALRNLRAWANRCKARDRQTLMLASFTSSRAAISLSPSSSA